MACSGQLHVEVELNFPAQNIWGAIRDSTILFPQALCHYYKSIQVLEGDGKAPGSIRLINYAEGSPIVKVSKERIESVDEAEKTYVCSIIDGDLLKYYKSFISKIIVIPKGESSLVKWSCEFEKMSGNQRNKGKMVDDSGRRKKAKVTAPQYQYVQRNMIIRKERASQFVEEEEERASQYAELEKESSSSDSSVTPNTRLDDPGYQMSYRDTQRCNPSVLSDLD